jgi:hypothetical protein
MDLAPDGEIEVSVDLVAPERPGRYVSHWRLVAPAGFGFIQLRPGGEHSDLCWIY